MELLTIGELGDRPLGWVARGVQTVEAMKAAAEYEGAGLDGWPRHTMVEITRARLECFGCGRPYDKRHVNGCDYEHDEDGRYVWNWGMGDQVTILMEDGRSVFDHFPHARPDETADTTSTSISAGEQEPSDSAPSSPAQRIVQTDARS